MKIKDFLNKRKNVILKIIFGLVIVITILCVVIGCSKNANAESVNINDGSTFTLKTYYDYTEEIEYLTGYIGMQHPTFNKSLKFLYNTQDANVYNKSFAIEIYLQDANNMYIFICTEFYGSALRNYAYQYVKRTMNNHLYWVLDYFDIEEMPLTNNQYDKELLIPLTSGFKLVDIATSLTTFDTNSTPYKQFHTFFNINKPVDLSEIGNKAYDTGYNLGLENGYNKGVEDGIIQGHSEYYDPQTFLDYGLEQYQRGLSVGSKEVGNSVSWFSSIFTGLSSIFGIKIFGDITLGLICLIPFSISFVWFIIKTFKGGS